MDFQPMSPDEMQRTMQFLLGHQAKFAVDFDKLSDKVFTLSEKTERIADSVLGVTAILGQLVTEQLATNQRIDRLHEVMMRRLPRDNDA